MHTGVPAHCFFIDQCQGPTCNDANITGETKSIETPRSPKDPADVQVRLKATGKGHSLIPDGTRAPLSRLQFSK